VIILARVSRQKSNSGIYHVMLRGINKQIIFEDDEDRLRFLETLEYYRDICKFKLYSYCLMDNHVHILIKEIDESISSIIKKLCSSYVYWYNHKYQRCGHLFQDRFKSEVVESDIYLLTVIRYIHQNPLKAGIIKNIMDSKWTSHSQYVNKNTFIDIDHALKVFSEDKEISISLYNKFLNELNADACLDYSEKTRISDNDVRNFIYKMGFTNVNEIQTLEKTSRDIIIRKLKEVEGTSLMQLSRITGISKSVIGRS